MNLTHRPAGTRLARLTAGLATDLQFVNRAISARPIASLLVVLTLAVVLGVSTNFFGLFFAARFRVHDAEATHRLFVVSPLAPHASLTELRRLRTLSGVGASGSTRRVIDVQPPRQVNVAFVTPGWFPTVRPRLVLGRGFTDRDHARGAEDVVVIAETLWDQLYQRADVLGRAVAFQDGTQGKIVGVMSRGFSAPRHRSAGAEVWRPFPDVASDPNAALAAVVRLAPGVESETAQREIDDLLADRNEPLPPGVARDQLLRLIPYDTYSSGTQQGALGSMFLNSLLLLLVGCANVATHLLSRVLDRTREHAVTLAVGAWPGRLVRQSFLVGTIFSIVAATLAAVLAAGLMSVIREQYVSAAILNPGFRYAAFGGPTLIFLAVTVLLVAGLISLPGAIQLGRTNIQAAIKGATRTHSGGRGTRRLRAAMLAVQVTFAIVLLSNAAALTKELMRRTGSKGFDARNVVYLRADFKNTQHLDKQTDFKKKVLARLARLPDVEAAALAYPEPLANEVDQEPASKFMIEGARPGEPALPGEAVRRTAGGDLLDVLRIPLVRGRWFFPYNRPDDDVAVIDENFAARFFPGADPIGRKLTPVRAGFSFTIVGVVGNVKHRLGDQLAPSYYLEYRSRTDESGVSFLVRARESPAAMTEALVGIVRQVEPHQAIAASGQYEDLIAGHVSSLVLQAAVTGGFGLIAILLAALGLTSAAVALVAARTHELGLRAAIGATPWGIVTLVLGQGLRPVLVGICVGHPLASVFNDPSLDWGRAIAVSGLVLLVALGALALPARRATRITPHSALRYE